ncbi:MAG: GNAT family N-acetyltransferase [Nitrospira sp.]|nr:GNAT family N-acetyltransferase [bacterium]MBL7047928.1 GNAT family N-acetyltransferase [Nitrospira sp.]
MVRQCNDHDFHAILEILNDGHSEAENNLPLALPEKDPMTPDDLHLEMASGMIFWGYEDNGELAGIMGVQNIDSYTLIRHLSVRPASRRRGIGSELLDYFRHFTILPMLVHIDKNASVKRAFYQKNGLSPLSEDISALLLKKYWNITEQLAELYEVLAE